MRDQKLLDACKHFMGMQRKLELYRDYNDYLDDDQVRDFLGYVEDQIKEGRNMSPSDFLYERFTNEQNWFNEYEIDMFIQAFREPFIELNPEFADQEDEADEILRELMYDMDLYDACIDHFDKDYNFYLLTDPCLTYELYDEQIPFVEYKHKYLKLLQKSQGRTANSNSMNELIHSGGYNGEGICIMLNCSLFDIINIMQSNKLTVRKGTDIYMFNPYIGTGGDTTELTSDWTFRFNLKEIGIGVDNARKGPWGYCPSDVYGRVHSYFNKNKITYKSLKSGK